MNENAQRMSKVHLSHILSQLANADQAMIISRRKRHSENVTQRSIPSSSESKRETFPTHSTCKKFLFAFFYFALCFFAKVEEQRTVRKHMRGSTRIDDQSKLLHLAFWFARAVSLQSQKKSNSSARFHSPVSALDLGFKRGFLNPYSPCPKRLQRLHWETLQLACLCPLSPQRLHSPVKFSGLREELFAVVPFDNEATFSLLAVAVCRL